MTTREEKLADFRTGMGMIINTWMLNYYKALPWTVDKLKELNIELTESTDINLLALSLIEGQDEFCHDDIEVTLDGFMLLAYGDAEHISESFGTWDPDIPWSLGAKDLIDLFEGNPMLAAEELVKAQKSYVPNYS